MGKGSQGGGSARPHQAEGYFKGDDDLMVDRLVSACAQQKKAAAAPLPGFGRELVPYFVPGDDEPSHSNINGDLSVHPPPSRPPAGRTTRRTSSWTRRRRRRCASCSTSERAWRRRRTPAHTGLPIGGAHAARGGERAGSPPGQPASTFTFLFSPSPRRSAHTHTILLLYTIARFELRTALPLTHPKPIHSPPSSSTLHPREHPHPPPPLLGHTVYIFERLHCSAHLPAASRPPRTSHELEMVSTRWRRRRRLRRPGGDFWEERSAILSALEERSPIIPRRRSRPRPSPSPSPPLDEINSETSHGPRNARNKRSPRASTISHTSERPTTTTAFHRFHHTADAALPPQQTQRTQRPQPSPSPPRAAGERWEKPPTLFRST